MEEINLSTIESQRTLKTDEETRMSSFSEQVILNTKETVSSTIDQAATIVNKTAEDFHPSDNNWNSFFLLSINSIGVIYEDIGTSPLYVLRTIILSDLDPVLARVRKLPVELRVYNQIEELHRQQEVLGMVSLVFWLLLIVPTLKYICLVLQADNKGEGGTFALVSLLPENSTVLSSNWRRRIFIVAIIGAGFLLGDGVVTPAISVLSATEGLGEYVPEVNAIVLPITCFILVGLFSLQKFGTERVGSLFAPIMVSIFSNQMLWFISIGLMGIYRITQFPAILEAIDPTNIIIFASNIEFYGFFKLVGTAILVITGVEAMYADLGHFKKNPIRAYG